MVAADLILAGAVLFLSGVVLAAINMAFAVYNNSDMRPHFVVHIICGLAITVGALLLILGVVFEVTGSSIPALT